ncbi:MAG: hypothetical protein WED05_10750 [Candidatus Atabeyarchaeum deiterrae]
MVLHDFYVIYNQGGRCIHHYKFGGLNVNSELVGAFLDALSSFAMETIPSKGQMRLIDRGNVKVLFEQGKYVSLALFASDNSTETRALLVSFLSKFEEDYGEVLKNWDGSLNVFNGLEDLVKSIFKREKVSLEKIPPSLLPKPIPLVDVTGAKMKASAAISVIRTAIQDSLIGVLSISLNPNKIDPIGYVSLLNGKGFAAVYTKPYSKVRRGTDAARHIIFDSVTLPAWIRFRIAELREIDTEIDRTMNKIDVPLNKVVLDTLLLRHQYDEIKNSKPKTKQVLSPEEKGEVHGRFGVTGVNVLTTSQGKITVDQLASLHGLSPLEVSDVIVWASERGLIELMRN